MHAITVEMTTLLRYVHQFQKKKNVVCPQFDEIFHSSEDGYSRNLIFSTATVKDG